jgi:hypothetical protein
MFSPLKQLVNLLYEIQVLATTFLRISEVEIIAEGTE